MASTSEPPMMASPAGLKNIKDATPPMPAIKIASSTRMPEITVNTAPNVVRKYLRFA